MQRYSLFLLVLTLLLASCDPVTDPDEPGTTTPGSVAMTALADLPRVGGDVTGVAIAADGRVFAAIDGKLYSMTATGGDPEIFNGDPVHTVIGLSPSGDLYAVAGTELRVYNPSDATFRRSPIDPAGPFATNGRIEDAEFHFSPSGEPYVRIISNYPRTYIYRTSDRGATWQGVTLPSGFAYAGGLTFAANGDLVMNSPFGFYRSNDRGATWTTTRAPRANYGGELFRAASGDIYHYVAGGGGLIVSRDGGASFTDLTEFNKAPFFLNMTQGSDGTLYALASRSGGGVDRIGESATSLLRSSDGGTTWRHLLFAQGMELAIQGTTIAVGLRTALSGEGGGVFISWNSGTTWKAFGLRSATSVTDIGFDRNGNLMLLAEGGIYRRVANAWQTLGVQQNFFRRFATTSEGRMIAASQYMINYSSDDGATWSESPIPDHQFSSSGPPALVTLLGLSDGDFLFTINNISTAYGQTNGHLYRVGSDGKAARIRGVSRTFARIVEERNGKLYGIEESLNSFSQTYERHSYTSNDRGVTWDEVANSMTLPLAANSQNRFLVLSGSNTWHLQTPGSTQKTEITLDGFSTQDILALKALFAPDDRLYMVTTDRGVYSSSGPVR